MCQRNWRQYNASLIQRGSLTFFCDPKVLKALRKSSRVAGARGRPAYKPQVIMMLMLLKLTYRLSYRACEGMAKYLLSPHKLPIPCASTLCRRMRELTAFLPKLSRKSPHVLLVDSSGFKILGEGEWKVKVQGKAYRRKWVKVHLAVDSSSREIVDLIVTDSSTADVCVGIQLVQKASRCVRHIYADGAYDAEDFRLLAAKRGAIAVVPPPEHAILRAEPHLQQRNDALRIITGLGGGLAAKRLWGKLTGYCHRVKVESAFSRLKRLFGTRLFSHRFDAIEVEVWLKALLSNIWLQWAY